jgi:hypothetical protein
MASEFADSNLLINAFLSLYSKCCEHIMLSSKINVNFGWMKQCCWIIYE